MLNLHIWFVMLLSWWSWSYCFSFTLFLITAMEFFLNNFIMFNWLNIWYIFDFSWYLWNLWSLNFILFIRILIRLITYKSVSFKVILLSRLFFLYFLIYTLWWLACFWSWTFLFGHKFFVKLVHKIDDLL